MQKSIKILIGIIIVALLSQKNVISKSAQNQATIKISVDPRVELMCTIARLAAFEEYQTNDNPAYVKEVEQYFGRYKDHDAVKFIRSLRPAGIGFEKVIQIAIAVKDVNGLDEIVPLDSPQSPLASNWTVGDARDFLKRARCFVHETNFQKFMDEHQSLYQTSVDRLLKIIEQEKCSEWLDKFYGKQPQTKLHVVLGMQTGMNSYGSTISISGKEKRIYSILGVDMADNTGAATFLNGISVTLVHEFSHSFINPLVDRYADQLQPAGEKMFAHVDDAMQKMHYGDWKIMLYESLVRACGMRHLMTMYDQKSIEIRQDSEEKRGFYWIGKLTTLLGEYEAQRDKYSDFESFFPIIVSFLKSCAGRVAEEIQAVKERTDSRLKALAGKSPKIVATFPQNDAQNVEPNLKEIKIVFDRRMKPTFSVLTRGVDMAEAPKATGKCGFDSTRTVFSWSVQLVPNTTYEFSLNNLWTYGFISEKGDTLVPTRIKFMTGRE